MAALDELAGLIEDRMTTRSTGATSGALPPPGLTVLHGYERTNQLQARQAAEGDRRMSSGLALVDRLMRVERDNARRAAFKQYGDDFEGLSTELIRQGDVQGAEAVRKFHERRRLQSGIQGALNPDGSLDYGKALPVLIEGGQVGPAMQFATKAEERAARTAQRESGRREVQAFAGIPGTTASADATTQDGSTTAPTGARRGGVFGAYLDHEDPLVRNTAVTGAQAIAMLDDPTKAANIARTYLDQINRHLDRTEGRRIRSDDRAADRDVRLEIAGMRGGVGDARAEAQASQRVNRILRDSLTLRSEDGKALGIDRERSPVVNSWAAQIRRADPSLSPEEAADEALSIPYLSRNEALAQAKRDVQKMRKEVGFGDRLTPGDSFANRFGMPENDYIEKRAQDLIAKSQRDAAERLGQYGIRGRGGQPAGSATGSSGPPAAAVEALRANPQLAPQFEQKYGVPAAQFLQQLQPQSSSQAPGALPPTQVPTQPRQQVGALPGNEGPVYRKEGANEVIDMKATVERDPRIGVLRQQIAQAMNAGDQQKVQVLTKALTDYVKNRYGGWGQ